MPPVLIAVAAAAASWGAAAAAVSIGVVAAGSFAAAMIGGLAGLAVTAIGGALLAQSNKPSVASLGASAQDRTLSVRQPIGTHKLVYGQIRVGGDLTYVDTTGSNKFLHLVITLNARPVAEIGTTIYLNDEEVPVLSSGQVSGKYAGYIFVQTGDGTVAGDQDFWTQMKAQTLGAWTTAMRQYGRAKVYVQLDWNVDLFGPTGIPNVTFTMKGRKVYDPRQTGINIATSSPGSPGVFTTDGTAHGLVAGDHIWIRNHVGSAPAIDQEYEVGTVPSSTTLTLLNSADQPLTIATGGTGGTLTKMGWTDNAALCVADYLCDPIYGLAAVYESEIDETALIAAANTCDEMVSLNPGAKATSVYEVVDPATDVIELVDMTPVLLTGTKVQVTTTGSFPGGLAGNTDYYCILVLAGGPAGFAGRVRLATSLANARAGIYIDIGSTGTGQQSITATGEPRYTANGQLDSGQTREDNVKALLSAMAGYIVPSGGLWGIFAGVYRTPTVTLDESDLRGPIEVQSLISAQDAFNQVKGIFVDPYSAWQPTDLPPWTNATYLAADDGEPIWADIQLPFTTSASAGQRLEKITLERMRRELTVTLRCKLTAFQVGVPDTIMVDNALWGWSGETFEVQSWQMVVEPDANNVPRLGVDILARQIDANVFAWSTAEQKDFTPSANTNLPDPFDVRAPGNPSIVESLYNTNSAAGVRSKATISWDASPDSFVSEYQVEYSISGTNNWTVLAPVKNATSVVVFDIAAGLYDFRVKARNTLGVSSSYATTAGIEIYGLSAAPQSVTNFRITPISGFAFASWDPAPDLDVQFGGSLKIRYSPLTDGTAAWQNSIDIGPHVDGNMTHATLPLISGTYLAKWIDSTGNESTNVTTFISTAPDLVTLAGATTTLTEDPTFGGVKTNCSVDSGVLKMAATGQWDDIADVDSVSNIDAYGGSIVPSATYLFASSIDNGSTKKCRIVSSMQVTGANILDQIDSRGGNVDDWTNWDGSAEVSSVNATVYYRETADNPITSPPTPTWSDWKRLDGIADANNRAFEFKVEMTSSDTAYAEWIEKLSVSLTLQ